MKTVKHVALILVLNAALLAPLCAWAGPPLQKCILPNQSSGCGSDRESSRGPTCGIELTCTDKPIQLGYSDGVCFRASCPGIWAIMHKRADQASFRNRVLVFRHYAFRGTWELKDQGAIESIVAPSRELFLVLPEDLIEFKLRDPDPNAAIEVVNLGYVKKGSIDELKKWLAYQIYLERPVFRTAQSNNEGSSGKGYACSPFDSRILANPFHSLGRFLGLGW